MHELSVALGIVEIAENAVRKANGKSVDLIELEIGFLAGIEFESLNFAWPIAVKNTVLENAKKKIHVIEGEAKCGVCDHLFKVNNIFDPCPKCKSYHKSITRGKELLVKSLEIY